MVEKKNPHEGHRERMKQRYLSQGLDGFAEHEVLEMLLFYSVPRADTNELAHALLDRFSDLHGVLSAEPRELCQVSGVKMHTAILFRLVSDVYRRSCLEKTKKQVSYRSMKAVIAYLRDLFIGVRNERVYMLLFDNGMNLQDTVLLAEGAVNSTAITYRTVAERALFHRSSGVILAHNHPGGIPVPSGSDLEVTRNVDNVLSAVGVRLIEHVVIADHSYELIIHGRSAGHKASAPLSFSASTCGAEPDLAASLPADFFDC